MIEKLKKLERQNQEKLKKIKELNKESSNLNNKLDELKSSTNVPEATFGRFQEIASQGLDAFSNTAFLFEYIQDQGFSVFGDGYGYSNKILTLATLRSVLLSPFS